MTWQGDSKEDKEENHKNKNNLHHLLKHQGYIDSAGIIFCRYIVYGVRYWNNEERGKGIDK